MATLFLAGAAGCSGGGAPREAAPVTEVNRGKIAVVTTIGILADLARNVGGDAVGVRALVPPGGDVETFRLSPRESIAISQARLILSNGGGLDGWLGPALAASKSKGAIHLILSEGLETPQEEPGGRRDPHLWQDPRNAIRYVERIRDALAQADPPRAPAYRGNAAAYNARLRDLDQEIAAKLEAVPPQRRRLVTFHDAFRSFARRYGWQVSALTASGLEEVSPQTVASMAERIRAEGVGAVFAEPQFSEDLLRQLARDLAVKVGKIYSDSLDDRVATYIDMMRYNAQSLVEGLR